jgi:hypothetical protein
VLASASKALAAPVDNASDHVALRAYERYVSAAVAGLPAASQSADAFVTSIATRCPNALAALNALPPSAVNQGSVLAIGEEIGLDVVAAENVPFRAPLAALTSALGRLHWSSPKTAAKIKSSLAAERRFLTLQPSDLCADAQALAATNFQTTPPVTLRFIATAIPATKGAGFTGLTRVLQAFQTRADGHVVDTINRHSRHLNSALHAQRLAEENKLIAALGITS